MNKRAEEWAAQSDKRVKTLARRLALVEKEKIMAESKAEAAQAAFKTQQETLNTILDTTRQGQGESLEVLQRKLSIARRVLQAGLQMPPQPEEVRLSVEEQRNYLLLAGLTPQEVDALGFEDEAL